MDILDKHFIPVLNESQKTLVVSNVSEKMCVVLNDSKRILLGIWVDLSFSSARLVSLYKKYLDQTTLVIHGVLVRAHQL